MATILTTNFDYTYDGKLITEVMYKPVQNTPALGDLFTILTGAKYKFQIPLLTPLDKVTTKAEGCERTFSGVKQITNTTLSLVPLEINAEFCKTDFEGAGNILAEEWLRQGIDEFNIDGTQLQRIINMLLTDAQRLDAFRFALFGDANDANADWNAFTGMIPSLVAGLAEGGELESYCVQGQSGQFSGALGTNEALDALRNAWGRATQILKSQPDLRFYVTGQVFDNLLASYTALGNTEIQMTYLQNGVPSMRFYGIPVIAVRYADTLLADSDNPLFGTMENFVILTTKANHFLGTDRPQDIENIAGWYERKDRKFYFEGYWRMGYQRKFCDLDVLIY
jgi:hypothetical protein